MSSFDDLKSIELKQSGAGIAVGDLERIRNEFQNGRQGVCFSEASGATAEAFLLISEQLARVESITDTLFDATISCIKVISEEIGDEDSSQASTFDNALSEETIKTLQSYEDIPVINTISNE